MQSIFDHGPPPPCPDPFNLAAHVLSHAADLGPKTALEIVGGQNAERLSYQDLEDRVLRMATRLLAHGLQPGDRVLIRLGNGVAFPLVFLAAAAVGLVPVPTSAQLTEPEVTAISNQLEPALIVAGAGIACPVGGNVPVIAEKDILDCTTEARARWDFGDPDRPGYIVYTSGTSGSPQAVVHAHRAVWARRMMVDGWTGLNSSDRLMHAGAFNWTYTLGTGLMDPWAAGATALVPEPGTKAARLPELLREHNATIFAAAPGIYRQVLRVTFPDLPSLRYGLSAGEKLGNALRDRWLSATGTAIHEAFGMSECSTFISGSPGNPAPKDTLGRPQPGRGVAILSDDGTPVETGLPGTIAVSWRDPGLMIAYLDNPDETSKKFSQDGRWFLTGDQGTMDETGAIAYLGRSDDMLNAGGYRVSPLEVEAALLHHPEVTDVAAIEIRVKADTSIIAAIYCSEHALNAGDLAAWSADRVARYKCPKLFIHAPALPRGATGKILRSRLRQEYEASHGQT